MFGKASTHNKSFEERLAAISSGASGTMRKQVSALPEGGAQLRARKMSNKLPLWKLLLAIVVGCVAMVVCRAGYLRAEPLLDAGTPMLSWFLLLLGDLGLAAIVGVLAMIALRMDKPALQGALAAGIVAVFAGDAHVAAAFPDAFSTIYTEDFVMKAKLDHGPILQALVN